MHNGLDIRKLKVIVMTILSFAIYSCSSEKEREYDVEIEDKRVALANKSEEIYIQDFNELSTSDKYAYFSNKIEQVQIELLANNITTFDEELEEIKEVYLETREDNSKLVVLKEKLINISERLPDDDFINIFISLKNYSFGTFDGVISGKITDFLLEEVFVGYENDDDDETKDPNLPDCNCNLGCDYYVSIIQDGSSEKGCNETSTGCGPFGLSGCYRVVKSGGIVVDL